MDLADGHSGISGKPGTNRNNRNNRRGNNSDNYSANTVRFDNASMSNFGVENGPSASNLDMVNNNYYYENNSSNSLVNNREETGSDEPEEIKYYVDNSDYCLLIPSISFIN